MIWFIWYHLASIRALLLAHYILFRAPGLCVAALVQAVFLMLILCWPYDLCTQTLCGLLLCRQIWGLLGLSLPGTVSTWSDLWSGDSPSFLLSEGSSLSPYLGFGWEEMPQNWKALDTVLEDKHPWPPACPFGLRKDLQSHWGSWPSLRKSLTVLLSVSLYHVIVMPHQKDRTIDEQKINRFGLK